MSDGTSLQQQAAGGRLVAFDMMRIFLAILVVVGHFSFSSHAVGRTGMHSSFLAPVTRYGYPGVDVFFIISGYFIMMAAQGRDWRSFMIARLSRIYPALAICATLTFIGTSLLGSYSYQSLGVLDWLGNVTGLILIPIVGQRIPMADVVYWTLQIEVAFYACVAIGLATGLSRLRLLTVMLAICLASMVIPMFMSERNLIVWALAFLSRFVVGGVLFELSRQWRSVAVWMIGAGGMTLLLIHTWQRAIEREALEHIAFNPWIPCTIMVVSTGILGYYALRPIRRPIPWIAFGGGASYPCYLIHHSLGCAIGNALGLGDSTAGVLALTAAMLGLAAAIHRVEKQAVTWLRQALTRLFHRRPPDSAAGTTSGPQRAAGG